MRLTVNQAAKHVGCSSYAIKAGIKQGRFPFIILGGRYLLEVDALEKTLRMEAEENCRKAREQCGN